MKTKKILLTLLIGMFLISLINLTSAQLYYKQSNELDLKVPCFYEDTRCSDTAECNISFLYPNSSFLVEEQPMTNLLNGYHNYTLNKSQTSVLGEYSVSIYCIDNSGTGYSTFTFEINPTGNEITVGQTIVSLGLIFVMMILSGLFTFFSFQFIRVKNLFSFGLLFMLLALFLSVYVLHLGYIFSRDILWTLAMGNVQYSIYFGVMWGLIVLGLFAMVLLTIKVIKEIQKYTIKKTYGEGYNSKTKLYE